MSMSILVFVPFFIGVLAFIMWASPPKPYVPSKPTSGFSLIKLTASRFLKIFVVVWAFTFTASLGVQYFTKYSAEKFFSTLTQPDLQTCEHYSKIGHEKLSKSCLESEKKKAEYSLTEEYAAYANSPMVNGKTHFWQVNIETEKATLKAYMDYMRLIMEDDSMVDELEVAMNEGAEEVYKQIDKLKSPFYALYGALTWLLSAVVILAIAAKFSMIKAKEHSSEKLKKKFNVYYQDHFVLVMSFLFFLNSIFLT